jgi:hypothetical protein
MLEEFQKYFNERIDSVKELNHKGNNRLFEVKAGQKKYLLKKYATFQRDGWDRGLTEFKALSLLYPRGFSVPRPIEFFKQNNIGIYSFEDGKRIDLENANERDIIAAASYIGKLNALSTKDKEDFALERTNCLTVSDYIKLLRERYDTIIRDFAGDLKEKQFLERQILPKIDILERQTLKRCRFPYRRLTIEEQIVSPGDFGLHNILFNEQTGRYIFHDLEYCGRDDPARPVLDLVHHEKSRKIPAKLRDLFIQECEKHLQDEYFNERVRIVDPLIGMNWVLIYMNVFSRDYQKHLTNLNRNVEEEIKERFEKACQKLDNLQFLK